MRVAENWRDYALLDASRGERLERWGGAVVIRPDPQAAWDTPRGKIWNKPDAVYTRDVNTAPGLGDDNAKRKSGVGYWNKELSPQIISYGDLRFRVSPTAFKHMGLFPEQAVNWRLYRELIERTSHPVSVLNLFAYTGGATLACAAAGASVCHVDASKGMVSWARENAALSGLEGANIRWIVDDCEKFVAREIRRGVKYDGIIMDPPSYGRGSGGEVWQLETKLHPLIRLCKEILSDNPLFFAVNTYTTGLSHSVSEFILKMELSEKFAEIKSDEIGLKMIENGYFLPCGGTAFCL